MFILRSQHLKTCCYTCKKTLEMHIGNATRLRGHVENIESSYNPGNFIAMLRLSANHNPVLKSHLDKPRLR